MYAGGGFLAQSVDAGQHGGVLVVDHAREVAAVVEQQVGVPRLAVLEDGLLDAPVVFGLGLALPREHRHAVGRHGRGGVILGGEDVAGRPPHLCSQRNECADEHRGLHRHVDAADHARSGERPRAFVAAAQRHQRRHLRFRQRDLAASKLG